MSYLIMQHQRGNHTLEHVYNFGSVIEQGTKKECLKKLVEMRKWCKNKFYSTSTNEKIREWMDYEMADIFFLKENEGKIERA